MKKGAKIALGVVGGLVIIGAVASTGGNGDKDDSSIADSSSAIVSSSLADVSQNENASQAADTSENSENGEAKEAYEVTYTNAILHEDSLGEVWVSAIAEVTNTGDCDLYMSSGNFDFEYEDGSLAASESLVSVFPQVISSGEKAYYYVDTIIDVNADSNLNIVPHVNAEKATIDKVTLPISDETLKTRDLTNEIYLSGRVENNTGEDLSMVYVSSVLYDSDGKPLAVLYTILTDDLKAGDKMGFEATGLSLPDNITPDVVAEFKTTAYPFEYQF